MNNFGQDIRYALRGLRKSPGFALVAIITLALGIGANTAIFTVVNAVFFHGIPVSNPEKLVELFTVDERKLVATAELLSTLIPQCAGHPAPGAIVLRRYVFHWRGREHDRERRAGPVQCPACFGKLL